MVHQNKYFGTNFYVPVSGDPCQEFLLVTLRLYFPLLTIGNTMYYPISDTIHQFVLPNDFLVTRYSFSLHEFSRKFIITYAWRDTANKSSKYKSLYCQYSNTSFYFFSCLNIFGSSLQDLKPIFTIFRDKCTLQAASEDFYLLYLPNSLTDTKK